jgi:hypothetical protein
MPKTPTDYSKTVIYYCYYDDILLYIGHTTNFTKRKNSHKSQCFNIKNEKYNLRFYKYIRDHSIDFDILRWECEKYPCDDVYEARRKEGEKIRELNSICNMAIPSRSIQEYYLDHSDYLKNKQKQRYENNKEVILEKQKTYNEINKEKIKIETKIYREKNKEKQKEYMSREWTCPKCSNVFKFGSQYRHLKRCKSQGPEADNNT